MTETSEARKTRLVVFVDPSGNGTIKARTNWGFDGVNGRPRIVGHIFWSGATSDFWTVEIRDHAPFEDDSAFFIAGTATSFDGAVRVASDYLAEKLEVLR